MSKKLSKDDVNHVAHLARLKFSESQQQSFVDQLNDILGYAELIESAQTDGVTAFYSPAKENMRFYDEKFQRREDTVVSSLSADEVLQNAPKSKQNQFSIEAVIEDE